MAFDASAAANRLVTILSGLSGMGAAQLGAPESIGKRVQSFVTLAGMSVQRQATAVTQRDVRFFCMFAYRVEGAEATAEAALMALVDAFIAALDADLTLAGNARKLEIDASLGDAPEYQLRAGKEFREYPVIVTVMQRDSYVVNP